MEPITCPDCGEEMRPVTSFSGAATKQSIKQQWACPKCKKII